MDSNGKSETAINNIAIVIRSVGERTEAACRALACEQVPEENVVVIRERPFGAAVRKTFQVGLERGLPWTLALDADVLLRANAVRDMLACAERQPETLFFANYTVADKLLGKVRPGGPHLYRTAHLLAALTRAGKDIDNHERPESHVRAKMSVDGFLAIQFRGIVAGLHDFEQSFRDIYRTAYTHALKHPNHVIAPCLAAWERLSEYDPDFYVALFGAKQAENKGGKAQIDDAVFPKTIEGIEGIRGLVEKGPFNGRLFDGDEVCRRIGYFSPFVESLVSNDLFDLSQNELGVKPKLLEKANRAYHAVGLARVPALAAGVLLRGVGTVLIRYAFQRQCDV